MNTARKNQLKKIVGNAPASVTYWSEVVEWIDNLNDKLDDHQFRLEGIECAQFPHKSDIEHLDREFYYGKSTQVFLDVRNFGPVEDKIKYLIVLVPLETKIEITAYFTA